MLPSTLAPRVLPSTLAMLIRVLNYNTMEKVWQYSRARSLGTESTPESPWPVEYSRVPWPHAHLQEALVRSTPTCPVPIPTCPIPIPFHSHLPRSVASWRVSCGGWGVRTPCCPQRGLPLRATWRGVVRHVAWVRPGARLRGALGLHPLRRRAPVAAVHAHLQVCVH